ncbi:MAG: helix-turn-helix domain-containing protein [Opitutaceae bacterium]|jgi:AraC family transcriptional regulator of arabinose operon
MEWREGNLGSWNLYFTLDGEGQVLLKDRTLKTEAGDLLLLPPKMERSYRVVEAARGWEFFWMHFKPTQIVRRQTDWFEQRKAGTYRVRDPGLRIRMAAILEELNEINLHRAGIPQRDRLMEVMTESVLLRIAGEQGLPRGALGSIDPRIAVVIDRIHRQIGAPHPLDELARNAGLSRSQFHLLFRASMGRSPQEYLEERRMELARFYLTTTALSVAEIAASVGYADPFYFTNRFRKRFAVSPRGLRSHQ